MTDKIAELVTSSGCSISIVAMGQWSTAGATMRNNQIFWGVGTTRFPDYEKELNAGIQTWKKGINFVLRNIHYNGLGYKKTGCPPEDHRIPPVIDGYNEIVQRLAKRNNIQYINSNSVIYPVVRVVVVLMMVACLLTSIL